MASLMLLIESLERVASSSKPDTSCPTSVSLTADPAVILSLFPPPCVSYLLKYTIHSSANTRLVKDRTAMMMMYCRTDGAPEKHQTGQIQSNASRAKAKGNIIFPRPHLDRRSGCPSCHICVTWTEANWMVADHKAKFNSTGLTLNDGSIPQPGILSPLDASHGSDSRSLTASCSETREHVEVEASRRQQAGASTRPQHRQRKWTEAATGFFFVFFAPAQNLSDGSGPSTWAPS